MLTRKDLAKSRIENYNKLIKEKQEIIDWMKKEIKKEKKIINP